MMKPFLSTIGGLLLGLSLFQPSGLAQTQLRDFTLRATTVASLCPGRLENPTDLVINETNGGIGTYLTADHRLPGITVQAIPLRQMGGEAAARSRLQQVIRGAEGDRNKSASQNTLGRGGVTLVQYDRDGIETTRSISFIQGDLFIAVTGITTTEVAACSAGGVLSLAQHISQGLLFADGTSTADEPFSTQDPSRLLAGAERVGVDRCLVALWSLESLPISQTLAQRGAMLLSTDAAAVDLQAPQMTGTQYMTIEPDGSVWIESSLLKVQVRGTVLTSAGDRATMTLENFLDGAAVGMMSFYRRGGETLLWAVMDQDDVTQDTVISYEARVQGRTMRDRQQTYSGRPEPSFGDTVITYRCTENTLTMTLPPLTDDPAEPPLTWRYTRL